MSQKLYPSAHILEMFMPYLHDEKRLIEVLNRIVEKDYYRNVELPSFPTKEHRDTVRKILKDNDLTAITFVAPFLNEQKMSLCDLDDRRREEVLDFLKMHADFAAESGYTTFGVPSGPYPGDEYHDEAMAAQADTLARIADYAASLGMNCSIEPLDRYAHKKALIGPMDEVVEWFRPPSEPLSALGQRARTPGRPRHLQHAGDGGAVSEPDPPLRLHRRSDAPLLRRSAHGSG